MLFQVPVELPDGSHLLFVPDPKLAAYMAMARLQAGGRMTSLTIEADRSRYTVASPGVVTTHYEQQADGAIQVEVTPTSMDLLRKAL